MKPLAPPDGPEARMLFTHEEIEALALEELHWWADVGSGDPGKIHLEILGCDDPPNMDSAAMGQKTAPFVSVAYEDVTTRTDTIAHCLRPRWPPWSARAFVFDVQHGSSRIYMSVYG